MTLTPEQRSMRARMAAYALHASRDPREHTRPAREAAFARFEKQVDPDGILNPEERRRRALLAQRSHMTRLALASLRARGRRKAS